MPPRPRGRGLGRVVSVVVCLLWTHGQQSWAAPGQPCPLGQVSWTGRCTPCADGYVKYPQSDAEDTGDAICVDASLACTMGEYATIGMCTSCPGGTVIGGHPRPEPALEDCIPCPPGTWRVDNATHTVCAPVTSCGTSGYLADDGQCAPCPPGTAIPLYPTPVGNQTLDRCTPCGVGQVRLPPNTLDGLCLPAALCGSSAYSDGKGVCMPCPDNTVILGYPLDSLSQTLADCKPCPDGQFKSPPGGSTSTATCVHPSPCGPAGYIDEGQCRGCPQGQVILGYPKLNQTAADCQVCPKGMVKIPDSDTDLAARCVDGVRACGSSGYAHEGLCKPCGHGKVIKGHPQSLPTADNCHTCPVGFIRLPDSDDSLDAECV